jgi:hypothetical protein
MVAVIGKFIYSQLESHPTASLPYSLINIRPLTCKTWIISVKD